MTFCRLLHAKTGREARLLTEAEWEYACRAGTDTQYNFGDSDNSLDAHVWHGGNSGINGGNRQTRPRAVAQKPPNAFGLYDMHGNVVEWCSDWYDGAYYGNGTGTEAKDPHGPDSGSRRVTRGGSWMFTGMCSSDTRAGGEPGLRLPNIGFRIALPIGVR